MCRYSTGKSLGPTSNSADPQKLPAAEKYTSARGEEITDVGEKNLNYEISKFGFNAQPLYMFIDSNQNVLSNIKYGYDADIDKFIHHLDEVKAKFDAEDPLKN